MPPLRSILLLGVLLTSCIPHHSSAAAPPNILLIISDDQCYRDFGFMGNKSVHTPHLDRLAGSSARFVNGYVPTSVCSPSLATLLTGLYPHQHRLHYNHPPPGNAAFNKMASREDYERVRSKSFARIRELPTLPRLLAKAGYRCLQTGKFWEGHYRNAGFTHGMTVFKPVPGQTFGGNRTLADGSLAAHGNGDHGLKIGRESMKPIDKFMAEAGETPWFIWYAPYLPHEPHDAPKTFRDLAAAKPGIKAHQLPYYASIAQFDDSVGQLLELTRKHGDSNNILICFVVDNGWSPRKQADKRGRFLHTRESKRSPFEDGLRTPILLSGMNSLGDSTEAGSHLQLVSTIDLVPTLLAAAKVAPPPNLPGQSLLPTSKGEGLPQGGPIFGEIYPGDATTLGDPSSHIAYRWIRDGDLKLIVPHRHHGKSPWGNYLNGPALYNLTTDPGEKTNLINNPAHAEDTKLLKHKLDAWWTPS